MNQDLLRELGELQAKTAARHKAAEEQWIRDRQGVLDRIDDLKISPISPLSGLEDFLARPYNLKFENLIQSLWDEFYEKSEEIVQKYA